MTERKPFEPILDEARWRLLYNLVLTKNVGDEITYREAEDLCQCDREAVLGAMYYARRRLEEDGERSVRTVARFGWIVMSASQEIDEAERRRKKAGKRVKDGLRITAAVNGRRDELSPFERERLDRETRSLTMLRDLMGRKRKSLGEMHSSGQQELTAG